MNDDKFVKLFGSPSTPELEGNNELEAAYSHGYLKLGGVKSVSGDEAQVNEEQLQAVITTIAAL